MTEVQIEIMKGLLQGDQVSAYPTGARIRDKEARPKGNINARTLYRLKPFLRKTKFGFFVLDRRKVRALHGNHSVKKLYEEISAK